MLPDGINTQSFSREDGKYREKLCGGRRSYDQFAMEQSELLCALIEENERLRKELSSYQQVSASSAVNTEQMDLKSARAFLQTTADSILLVLRALRVCEAYDQPQNESFDPRTESPTATALRGKG